MKFARVVFNVAGVYGVLALVPQYFMEAKVGRDFPPPITHPEHFYGFLGVALAWQILFFIIARDPVRYRAAMWPAMFEKLSFGIATIALFTQGRLAVPIVAAGAIDIVCTILFFIAWRSTR
ncbi:MAG: hypothetical protein QOI24_2741 [Acidobacteriota bacterium]|jgi:hypothetical protein|nr:hypothetical protein [Acidobacteriota bacterium]